MLGFMALVTGLCNNAMAGPDGCTAEDEAQMQRYGVAAVVSPVAAIGVYALIEVPLHRQRSRRMPKS